MFTNPYETPGPQNRGPDLQEVDLPGEVLEGLWKNMAEEGETSLHVRKHGDGRRAVFMDEVLNISRCWRSIQIGPGGIQTCCFSTLTRVELSISRCFVSDISNSSLDPIPVWKDLRALAVPRKPA